MNNLPITNKDKWTEHNCFMLLRHLNNNKEYYRSNGVELYHNLWYVTPTSFIKEGIEISITHIYE